MKLKSLISLACLAATAVAVNAAEPFSFDYEGGVTATAGSGDFAPLYMSAMRHGTLTQSCNALVNAALKHDLDTTRRFSYTFGAEAYAGWQSSTDYEKYVADEGWSSHSLHPSRLWLQQLWGGVKYRGVFLTVGMQNQYSPFLNEELTSGDLIESGNSRPMPGVRAGFVNFQNIPFTRGWVQIEGQIFYGKYIDSDWWLDHYNYYNQHVSKGQYHIYRRCYFRTKPTERFSVTIGVQCASQFGGTTYYYNKGSLWRTDEHPASLKDFVKMFWPLENSGEDFYQGNTLGSWDFRARYRMRDNAELSAYFQWPWEDGSGMGKLNGFDGLWGIEYKFPERMGWVNAAAVELLTLNNQSGPLHWDPVDTPGTNLGWQTTGADDYYNNAFYNPYATFGMAMGTPMAMAPIYNRDGFILYAANRVKAVHLAVTGRFFDTVDYRVKLGHRTAWGNGKVNFVEKAHSTSFSIEGSYPLPWVKGLNLKAQFAFDIGNLPTDAVGGLVSLTYNGSFGR